MKGIGNSSPCTHGFRMLLRRVHFHTDRTGIILFKQVLDRIHIMLPHITEASPVVVPVSTKISVYSLFIIRFERRRAQPHIIIKLFRNLLRFQVGFTTPVAFPIEARSSTDGGFEWPS